MQKTFDKFFSLTIMDKRVFCKCVLKFPLAMLNYLNLKYLLTTNEHYNHYMEVQFIFVHACSSTKLHLKDPSLINYLTSVCILHVACGMIWNRNELRIASFFRKLIYIRYLIIIFLFFILRYNKISL